MMLKLKFLTRNETVVQYEARSKRVDEELAQDSGRPHSRILLKTEGGLLLARIKYI